MFEQRAPDTFSHVLGIDPHVLQLSERLAYHQRAAAGDLAIDCRHKNFIVRDEVRRNRQVSLPVIDPCFGITPMSLGGVGKGGKRGRFVRQSSADLKVHGVQQSNTGCSVEDRIESPSPFGRAIIYLTHPPCGLRVDWSYVRVFSWFALQMNHENQTTKSHEAGITKRHKGFS